MGSITRRDFLTGSVVTAAAAFGVPYIVPSSVFGANAPSNRIVMGCIGTGNMGTNNMMGFVNNHDVQVVAVCDVEKGSTEYNGSYSDSFGKWFGREPARKRVEAHYARQNQSGTFKGCMTYRDFRELLARDDIDAVTICTPDHWHAAISVMAAKAGKDIYCEKPMTLTIAEGSAMIEAVRRYGVVFQTGSHLRSNQKVRFACELVRNGRIGQLKKIDAVVGPNNKTAPACPWQPMPVPEGFDYDMWLGPAPRRPYHKMRCHYTFRFILDYSGGQTTNLGAHSFDIAQWGNGTDHTGPVEIEDCGSEFPKDGLFTTPTYINFQARYANGVQLTCRTRPDNWTGARFEGTEGWVEFVDGKLDTYPKALKKSVVGPNEIRLYKSDNHKRNFLDCIKSRREPAAPVEIGHRSATICHLGNIAMMLKQKLQWDPDKERFINNDQANRMLSRPMRTPWHL